VYSEGEFILSEIHKVFYIFVKIMSNSESEIITDQIKTKSDAS
jgi:hypothetical protein